MEEGNERKQADRSERGEKKTRAHTAHRARARAREREHETQQTEKTQKNKREKRPQPGEREVVDYSRLRAGLALSMGKRENPQPASWKSQLSAPSSHLSIVIAYFFYRLWAQLSMGKKEG